MDELARLLAGMDDNDGRSPFKARFPHVDAQVATLTEFAAQFSGQSNFKVGDFVSPRDGMATKGCGRPHVVVELIDPPIVATSCNPGSNSFGMRLDMKVLCYADDGETVVAHCVESWQFEPFSVS